MKLILFGATGMVGQGALKAALADPGVERVLAVVRSPIGVSHDKLRERVHRDFNDYSALAGELAGYDACLFCLGVSAGGLSEAEYTAITYDVTLAAAKAVVAASPAARFLYVSGAGTDSTEKGRAMWARVKGRTENALRAMPFKSAHMLRPGAIQPMDGIVSKTPAYRTLYTFGGMALSAREGHRAAADHHHPRARRGDARHRPRRRVEGRARGAGPRRPRSPDVAREMSPLSAGAGAVAASPRRSPGARRSPATDAA
jgi:uncharacterized protein YbjT (DUF2867 family)